MSNLSTRSQQNNQYQRTIIYIIYLEIILARDPKQYGGSKRIMYSNVDDDLNVENNVDEGGDVVDDDDDDYHDDDYHDDDDYHHDDDDDDG